MKQKPRRFPFDFVLTSTFRLDGKTVHHTLGVHQPGTEELRFGIVPYPAFNILWCRARAHRHGQVPL